MAAKRIVVQCIEIADTVGSLQALLTDAAEAGVDLQCFTAFSAGGGKGQVCLSAKEPAGLADCLKQTGIEATEAAGFIVGGDDTIGAAAKALKGLADAGINGKAGAAIVCGEQYHMLIVVDAADADAAVDVL
ncbi:hypothetical protein ACFL1G_03230 [Planctomycetota bacterium]